jgi:predicted acetyltransferase
MPFKWEDLNVSLIVQNMRARGCGLGVSKHIVYESQGVTWVMAKIQKIKARCDLVLEKYRR